MGILCTICLGSASVPVATPCGHIFCEVCIMACINHGDKWQSDVDVSLCPTCRTPFSIAPLPMEEEIPEYMSDFVHPPLRRLYFSDAPERPVFVDPEEVELKQRQVKAVLMTSILILGVFASALR